MPTIKNEGLEVELSGVKDNISNQQVSFMPDFMAMKLRSKNILESLLKAGKELETYMNEGKVVINEKSCRDGMIYERSLKNCLGEGKKHEKMLVNGQKKVERKILGNHLGKRAKRTTMLENLLSGGENSMKVLKNSLVESIESVNMLMHKSSLDDCVKLENTLERYLGTRKKPEKSFENPITEWPELKKVLENSLGMEEKSKKTLRNCPHKQQKKLLKNLQVKEKLGKNLKNSLGKRKKHVKFFDNLSGEWVELRKVLRNFLDAGETPIRTFKISPNEGKMWAETLQYFPDKKQEQMLKNSPAKEKLGRNSKNSPEKGGKLKKRLKICLDKRKKHSKLFENTSGKWIELRKVLGISLDSGEESVMMLVNSQDKRNKHAETLENFSDERQEKLLINVPVKEQLGKKEGKLKKTLKHSLEDGENEGKMFENPRAKWIELMKVFRNSLLTGDPSTTIMLENFPDEGKKRAETPRIFSDILLSDNFHIRQEERLKKSPPMEKLEKSMNNSLDKRGKLKKMLKNSRDKRKKHGKLFKTPRGKSVEFRKVLGICLGAGEMPIPMFINSLNEGEKDAEGLETVPVKIQEKMLENSPDENKIGKVLKKSLTNGGTLKKSFKNSVPCRKKHVKSFKNLRGNWAEVSRVLRSFLSAGENFEKMLENPPDEGTKCVKEVDNFPDVTQEILHKNSPAKGGKTLPKNCPNQESRDEIPKNSIVGGKQRQMMFEKSFNEFPDDGKKTEDTLEKSSDGEKLQQNSTAEEENIEKSDNAQKTGKILEKFPDEQKSQQDSQMEKNNLERSLKTSTHGEKKPKETLEKSPDGERPQINSSANDNNIEKSSKNSSNEMKNTENIFEKSPHREKITINSPVNEKNMEKLSEKVTDVAKKTEKTLERSQEILPADQKNVKNLVRKSPDEAKKDKENVEMSSLQKSTDGEKLQLNSSAEENIEKSLIQFSDKAQKSEKTLERCPDEKRSQQNSPVEEKNIEGSLGNSLHVEWKTKEILEKSQDGEKSQINSLANENNIDKSSKNSSNKEEKTENNFEKSPHREKITINSPVNEKNMEKLSEKATDVAMKTEKTLERSQEILPADQKNVKNLVRKSPDEAKKDKENVEMSFLQKSTDGEKLQLNSSAEENIEKSLIQFSDKAQKSEKTLPRCPDEKRSQQNSPVEEKNIEGSLGNSLHGEWKTKKTLEKSQDGEKSQINSLANENNIDKSSKNSSNKEEKTENNFEKSSHGEKITINSSIHETNMKQLSEKSADNTRETEKNVEKSVKKSLAEAKEIKENVEKFSRNSPNEKRERQEMIEEWTKIMRNGLSEELKNKHIQKYRINENYEFLKAQKLNRFLESELSENVIKSDQREISKQTQIASALIAIDGALSTILNHENDLKEISGSIKFLVDAARILADLHHSVAMKRRLDVIGAFHLGDIADLSPIEDVLFSEQFSTILKSEKLILKSRENNDQSRVDEKLAEKIDKKRCKEKNEETMEKNESEEKEQKTNTEQSAVEKEKKFDETSTKKHSIKKVNMKQKSEGGAENTEDKKNSEADSAQKTSIETNSEEKTSINEKNSENENINHEKESNEKRKKPEEKSVGCEEKTNVDKNNSENNKINHEEESNKETNNAEEKSEDYKEKLNESVTKIPENKISKAIVAKFKSDTQQLIACCRALVRELGARREEETNIVFARGRKTKKKTANTLGPDEPFPGIIEAVKRAYLARRWPEGALEAAINASTLSTMKTYESSIRSWWDFCKRNTNVDFYNATAHDIVQFWTLHEHVISNSGVLATWRSAMAPFTEANLEKDKFILSYVKRFRNDVAKTETKGKQRNFVEKLKQSFLQTVEKS